MSSRLTILGMLLLAGATSAAAIWYLRGLSHRSMSFWGPAAGELILQAPQVELLRLAPAESLKSPLAEERLILDRQAFDVIQWRDISQVRGLANVRRALMQDASYDWSAHPPAPPVPWSYALRFKDGDRTATLLFVLDPPAARLLDRDASVGPRAIVAGLRDFFTEQFPESK